MTESDAARFLAGTYAQQASRGPLDRAQLRDGAYAADALEAIGLLEADEARAWRARFARLAQDWTERPLLPDELRRAARSYRDAQTLAHPCEDRWAPLEAQRVLEAVGALSWRDGGPAEDPALVVDRVIAAPTHPPGALTVAGVVLFDRAVRVHWYASEPLDPGGDRLDALELRDDAGTRYVFDRGFNAAGTSLPIIGASGYLPAPPRAARQLEVARHGVRVVRIPLAR